MGYGPVPHTTVEGQTVNYNLVHVPDVGDIFKHITWDVVNLRATHITVFGAAIAVTAGPPCIS